jgi:hypothetical protein
MYPWPLGEFDNVMDAALEIAFFCLPLFFVSSVAIVRFIGARSLNIELQAALNPVS